MGNTAARDEEFSQTALPGEADGSKDVGEAEWRQRLTSKQFFVLRNKGTDPPNTGAYDETFDEGVYVCAACGTPLYTHEHKFACGCGWPGFWTNLPKAVREEPDADGRRVEIVCNACNGHLGHVFRGEGFKNPRPQERHCVNSTSVRLIAPSDADFPSVPALNTYITEGAYRPPAAEEAKQEELARAVEAHESSVATRVRRLIADNNVMVFSKSYCPFCAKAKRALQSVNATFEVLELDQDPDGAEIQAELARLSGRRTVPNVYVKGSSIGGGDETAALARTGRLAELIAA